MNSKLKAQGGMTLLEVMVAILIFSFGLSSLVGLQARMSQISTDTQDRIQASLLANNLATKMLTEQSVTLSTADWEKEVRDTLPEGAPDVQVDVLNRRAVITIEWKAPSKAGGDPKSRYRTTVVIVS